MKKVLSALMIIFMLTLTGCVEIKEEPKDIGVDEGRLATQRMEASLARDVFIQYQDQVALMYEVDYEAKKGRANLIFRAMWQPTAVIAFTESMEEQEDGVKVYTWNYTVETDAEKEVIGYYTIAFRKESVYQGGQWVEDNSFYKVYINELFSWEIAV